MTLQRTWEPSPRLTALVVSALAVASAFVLGADVRAAYPRGDGGMFDAVIGQIIAGGFRHPAFIAYNGLRIPFAYSPAAFYAVALLAKHFALSIPQAMNLWVIGWDALIAPAAYLASRSFLRTRLEALAATAVLIVFPGNLAWLGMGGAVTRAPGFVCFLLACWLTQRGFKEPTRSSAALAGIAAALAAWFHMEFFLLYAVSAVVLIAFDRPTLPVVATLAAYATLFSLPWILFERNDLGAFVQALHTSHGGEGALAPILAYTGLNGDSWLAALGTLCALAAGIFGRNYLWLCWMLVLVAVDSRAGQQAAHLPSALALASCAGRLLDARLPSALRTVAFAGVTLAIAIASASSARTDSLRYVRLDAADGQNLAHARSLLRPDADVITLFPGAASEAFNRDETFEWLPALTGARSSVAYQGLEWISAARFADTIDFFYRAQLCARRQPSCVWILVRHRFASDPHAYVYISPHGSTFPELVHTFMRNQHFALVYGDRAGALFHVLSASGEADRRIASSLGARRI